MKNWDVEARINGAEYAAYTAKQIMRHNLGGPCPGSPQ